MSGGDTEALFQRLAEGIGLEAIDAEDLPLQYTPCSTVFIAEGYVQLELALAWRALGLAINFELHLLGINSIGDLAYYNSRQVDRVPFLVYLTEE